MLIRVKRIELQNFRKKQAKEAAEGDAATTADEVNQSTGAQSTSAGEKDQSLGKDSLRKRK